MAKQTPEETRKANESISRPDGKAEGATAATTTTGRYGVAAKAIVDDGADKSETERVADKASRNDDR